MARSEPILRSIPFNMSAAASCRLKTSHHLRHDSDDSTPAPSLFSLPSHYPPHNRTGTHISSADESGIIKYTINLTGSPAHQEVMRGLSFSPNDARFAPASDNSTVCVRSFPEGREEHVLPGHRRDVKCVKWHTTVGLLVSTAWTTSSSSRIPPWNRVHDVVCASYSA